MFFEPQPTPLDLHFRLFGTPVRVHPLFWLVSALLGWNNYEHGGIKYLLLWILCVFASILIHEMGHVLAGHIFGSRGHIVLHSFGGLAIGSSNISNRWQRIAVYFAGPLAQLIFFALLYCLQKNISLLPTSFLVSSMGEMLDGALIMLIWINWAWALLNLLPIYPLDGGRISRDFIDWLMPQKGVQASLVISLMISALIAVNSILVGNGKEPLIPYFGGGGLYMAIFFAMFGLANFQELQQMRAHQSASRADRASWEQDPDYWK